MGSPFTSIFVQGSFVLKPPQAAMALASANLPTAVSNLTVWQAGIGNNSGGEAVRDLSGMIDVFRDAYERGDITRARKFQRLLAGQIGKLTPQDWESALARVVFPRGRPTLFSAPPEGPFARVATPNALTPAASLSSMGLQGAGGVNRGGSGRTPKKGTGDKKLAVLRSLADVYDLHEKRYPHRFLLYREFNGRFHVYGPYITPQDADEAGNRFARVGFFFFEIGPQDLAKRQVLFFAADSFTGKRGK